MNLLDAMRYLAALEQHRHFGRAAQACHITQPALSNAIRALEAELGVPVVRRSRQYEGLTAEGEIVLAHGHRLLRESESLRQELHALAGAPRGRLQIGAVPTAVPVAARFAARLQQRHPGIVTVLRSLSSPEIEAGLENQSIDLALGYSERAQVGARGLQVRPQYSEAYYLVQRGGGQAALHRGEPLAWRDATAWPLALLTPDMHHRAIVEGAAAEAGVTLAPVLETNSFHALGSALAEGTLAAVMPGAVLHTLQGLPGLTARALVEPTVHTPIGFITAAGVHATRTVQAALALAQDAGWLADLPRFSGELVPNR